MTQQPPTPPRPPSPAARFARRLFWSLAILALILVGGDALLIGAWVVFNPRW